MQAAALDDGNDDVADSLNFEELEKDMFGGEGDDNAGAAPGDKQECAYDEDVQMLVSTLADCPADACKNGYLAGADKDTAVVCYHKNAKKCGCESGCQKIPDLVQCVQTRPSVEASPEDAAAAAPPKDEL